MPEQTSVPTESVVPSAAHIAPSTGIPVLRSARALLTEAWEIYKKHAVTIVGIVLAFVVMSVVLAVAGVLVLAAIGAVNLNVLMSGEGAHALTGNSTIALLVIALVALLAFVAAYLWCQLAVILTMVHSSESLSAAGAYRRARPLLMPYSGLVVLAGLLIGVGVLLLIVPGIIAGVWFSSAVYIFAAEDVRGAAALRKSREYVRGMWGAVFAKYAYMCGLIFVLNLVLGFISNNLSTVVSMFVVTPLSAAYGYVLYKDLKRVKPTL